MSKTFIDEVRREQIIYPLDSLSGCMAKALIAIDDFIRNVNEVTNYPENKGATVSKIMNETLGVISKILEGKQK